jgi:hypothetical protein
VSLRLAKRSRNADQHQLGGQRMPRNLRALGPECHGGVFFGTLLNANSLDGGAIPEGIFAALPDDSWGIGGSQ